MKFIIIVPDGMADEPVAQLNNRTPLEAAKTPNMDFLAKNGLCGMVQTIPDGLPAGSDIGNLALMGYDPALNFSGRAPLEAANMGVMLDMDEVAFRCNLVTIKDGKMHDYSAGHITTEEASNLIEYLERALSWPDIRFYVGKSYRHLLVVKTINVERMLKVKTTPPHDILNQNIVDHLPKGPQADLLLNIMERSTGILEDHPINKLRISGNDNPATMIWLWGQGNKPELPGFKEIHGLSGSVISAVDLVNGIGRLAGLNVVDVPGANGYYDTNYLGKAQYAIESLKHNDFVYVHVESPDEAGHNGDHQAKKECIEKVDSEVVGTILNYAKQRNDIRILLAPDHPTPVAKRVHTRNPVPFVIYGKGIIANNIQVFTEAAASAGIKFQSGKDLVHYFMNEKEG